MLPVEGKHADRHGCGGGKSQSAAEQIQKAVCLIHKGQAVEQHQIAADQSGQIPNHGSGLRFLTGCQKKPDNHSGAEDCGSQLQGMEGGEKTPVIEAGAVQRRPEQKKKNAAGGCRQGLLADGC